MENEELLENEAELQESSQADATDTIQETITSDTITPQPVLSILFGVTQVDFNRLTKKNQQFMVDLDKQLNRFGKATTALEPVYQEMVKTLLDGQTKGQTAKQLYGTPSETAKVIADKIISTQEATPKEPAKDWQVILQGGLLLGSVYTFITAFSAFSIEKGGQGGLIMGILALLVNYIAAGYAMLRTSKVMPNPDAPKGQRGYGKYILVSTVSMMVWIALVMATQLLLPPAINPTLSGSAYIVIGCAGLLLHYYLGKRWNIQDGMF